jgi:hypothetical protein
MDERRRLLSLRELRHPDSVRGEAFQMWRQHGPARGKRILQRVQGRRQGEAADIRVCSAAAQNAAVHERDASLDEWGVRSRRSVPDFPYQCRQCAKSFRQPSQLMQHQDNKHNNTRMLQYGMVVRNERKKVDIIRDIPS